MRFSGQEEEEVTEDEMVRWHHRLEKGFEQTLGDSEGQGSLACCSPWGHKGLDTTWQLNNNISKIFKVVLITGESQVVQW